MKMSDSATDLITEFFNDPSTALTDAPRIAKDAKLKAKEHHHHTINKREAAVVLKALRVAKESFYFSGMEQRDKDRHRQAINIMRKLVK